MLKKRFNFSLRVHLIIGMIILVIVPMLGYSYITFKVLRHISAVEHLSAIESDLRALYLQQAIVLVVSILFALLIVVFITRTFMQKVDIAGQVITSNVGKKIETPPFHEFSKLIEIVNDATGRTVAELDLVKGILENLPVGVIASDDKGRFTYVNDRACRILGYETVDLLGINYRDLQVLTKAEPYDRSLQPLKDWSKGKTINDFHIKIVRKGGSLGSIEVSVYPFTDQSGKNIGGLSVIHDVSLENRYMMLKNWSNAVIDCLQSGLVAIDRDLRVTVFNKTAQELFELSAAEVIGKHISKAMPPLSDGKPIISQTVLTDKPVRNHSVKLAVGGKEKVLLLNIAVINDERGEVVGAAAVFQDITELRMFQDKMSEQEKLAVVGQMAAGMAHELRNPLTAVRGFIQLIHGRMLQDSDTREYFELIMQEIDRTNEIIRDFLILAKPKPPVLTLHPINMLLEDLFPLMESQCLLNNIQVNKEFAKILPPAVLDADQIKQVLLNLIQNAVQSMDGQANAVLTLRTSYDQAEKMVVITVGDSGQGIKTENLAKLGTPFFTTKDHGTGLGLSVSYKIIEAHRGKIVVESQPGQGTNFKIFIPAGYL